MNKQLQNFNKPGTVQAIAPSQLLMAWARYEDELDGKRKENAIDTRIDWGRVARRFLENEL
ncbi:hypothetical protein CEN50_15320 [Fischerella thermalis CCMEE 5268]|uniref:Uncharacterized protein n=1 Tax=Fischerella thermalis CCMEE 5268 TaxID=2019662 RepID=A0A2N6KEE5_9CYAN|nr:hypothetical protein CEN50_15320 [Fischerella thermalis CCMEE 5268]